MKNHSLAAARDKGAQLIEGVLSGSVSVEIALDQWPLPINSASRTLTEAWTCLSHYADDKDLHESDPEYAASSRQQLQHLACSLRAESKQLGDLPSRGFIKEILHSVVHHIKKS
jgi:hypothetical protein